MAYLYYRTITIDQTKVPSDLVNFPVLVSFTNNSLRTTGNGGNVTSASGFDIILSSSNNLDGSDKIPHEIESYTAASGAIIFWAKVAAVSSSVPTIFYILYGNSAIVTSQEDVANVWDSSFKGVYHLKDIAGAAPSLVDSTGNAKNLTNAGGTFADIAGQIDGGADVDTNNLLNASFGTFTFPFTYSAWVNADDDTGGVIIGHTAGGNNGTRMGFDNNGSGSNLYPNYVLGGVAGYNFTSTTPATNSQKVFIAIVVTGAGTSAKGWLGLANGTLTSQTIATSASVSGTPDRIILAARDGANIGDFNGMIDEVRFANTNRADGWITAEYNNQLNPGTFFAVGSEVTSVLTVTASDTFTFTDAAAEEVGLLVVAADSYDLADEDSVEGPDPAIAQSDLLNLQDTALLIAAFLLDPFGDTLDFQDSATLEQLLQVQFSDTLSLSDSASVNTRGTLEQGDLLFFTDEVKLLLGLFLSLSDTLTFQDNAEVSIIQEISVSDTLTFLDAVVVSLSNTILSLTFTDTLVLTDEAALQLYSITPPIDNKSYYRRYLNDVN